MGWATGPEKGLHLVLANIQEATSKRYHPQARFGIGFPQVAH
jgi:hypothetical protein